MKFLYIFIYILCFFPFILPYSSQAQENVVRGVIGAPDTLNRMTDEQIEEALRVTDNCKQYGSMSEYYDCDCLGMSFLEIRRKKGDKYSAFFIEEEAKRKCPNTPSVAGKIYSQCLEWAPRQRGEDYEPFCACYGSSFAKLFGKNPRDNVWIIEAQMTEAMQECDVNAPNERAKDRAALIQDLKGSGLYEQLFPSAIPTPSIQNIPVNRRSDPRSPTPE
jgi:hypothetical protein